MFWSNKSMGIVAKRFTVCALAVVASGEMADEAFAGARITITYDLVKTPIAPQQQTIRTSENRVYTLHGNQVDFAGSRGLKTGTGMKLGNDWESQTSNGRRFKLTYRILDGVLFIVSDFRGYATLRKIRTDGKNSCSSTLESKRRLVIRNFEMPELNVAFSEIHAENITCSIFKTAD
jgi:hypothetical protein